ncbi:hypothetical protein E2562_033441 [Oryza meyeriana var. granulata]|uniref:Uncharacterized protein n=1 Tax=Oryza meyeriana var. granulata TaxID=110450 RepID=A0A6G1E5S8_9ORYZ|nr:hypothetical protein E2562_033441 [Oryza meyeriana var. granulata]
MEELQEADVLWPADHHRDYERCRHHAAGQSAARPAPLPSPSSSAPVRIPAPTTFAGARGGYEDDDGARTDSAGASTIVPPHVFVATARRCSEGRTVASSVCVGHGRTLKGRDLRAVRNAVLHMTGFLGGPDEY